ncbi:unnamed protein product [Closterium sp. NIES-53]
MREAERGREGPRRAAKGRHTGRDSGRVESVHTGYRASSGSCVYSGVRVRWHHRRGLPSLPRLRGRHSRLLVSGLPRSLPPLPPSPAPPCLPCVEGRQRAAPHSSSFPPTTAPLQTLHMDVWGPARVSGQGRERYFLLVVDDYTRYTWIFLLRSKGQDVDVLIPWICAVQLQLRERFRTDLPVLRLHSDRGGEFSSNLLRDFCRGEGILQSFTLPDSPQQNGIAKHRIGLVMEVACTSMIHAAAPHFLWSFAVRYAAHQLNLWARVSFPDTSFASVFRVWGSRAFVRDTSAGKFSARAIPFVFLGFPPDAPGWQFYHPTLCYVFPSQDVTFDESVPFYRLFPYRSAPPLPPPLFLAPDPFPGTAPVEVSVGSGVARGAASGGVEPGVAESEGAGSGGAEPGGEEPGGAEPTGVEPGGVGPGGVGPGAVEPGFAESEGAGSSGGPAGASPRLSPQQLREWLVWRARLQSGATGAGGAGAARAGGAGVTAGAGGTGGTAATGPGGARTRGTGAAGTGSVGGAGAGDPTEIGSTGAGGSSAGGARAGGNGAGAGAVDPGGTVRSRPYFVPLLQQVLGVPSSTSLTPPLLCPPPDQWQLQLQPASPLPAPSPYTEPSGGLTEHHEPASRPVSPVRTTRRVPHSRLLSPAPTLWHFVLPLFHCVFLCLLLLSPLFLRSLTLRLTALVLPVPLSLVSSPLLSLTLPLRGLECLAAAVPRFTSMLLAPEGDPDATDIPTPRSYTKAIMGPYSSRWQAAMNAEMASWKSTGIYVDKVPPPGANIVDGMWIFRVKWPPDSPPAFKARYVASGFSQRQGVDYFHTFSPSPKMTNLRVLLHVAAQRNYELHSLDISTAFLQGSLHEEIWLRRPLGFTGSFPAGTQWSLRRPVYGLRQAPREWHDALRTTLAALGFTPSTADPSLFLRTDTSLPLFYVLVYVDDLVFATADTEALTLVQKRHTWTDLGELRSYLGLQITRDRARRTITLTQSHMVHQVLQRFGFQFSSPHPTPLSTGHSLSAPPSDESVEPSGLYPELMGCLMYLMTCTRPDLAYPSSLLARYVAPGRHRKVHWEAAKRVLRYLCSTSGMGLVLGGPGPVVLTSHADASWVDDSATQQSSQGYTFCLGSCSVSRRSTRSSSVLSSSCEAEIYAGAMAAQELCWLTYLLTDLGEQLRSPPVLYVDNKAMIALC